MVGNGEPSSSSFGPVDLHLPAVGQTVAQVQVDEALVRHTGLVSHPFDLLHNVLRQPHRDGLLQLGRIWVLARL